MKFKALFFSLFISIYSFSQSADITEGCIGMKVQFSAPSAGTWEFGDGTSSGQQNPVHIYTQPNTYQIKFNGVITPITIKVLPKPEIIITATPSKGCNPLNVAFKATLKNTLPNGVTVDNSSIEWNYQDGNNSTNTLTPNYTYTKSGEFNLGFYLNFKQNGNTACAKIDTTINNIIRVTDKPIIDFTPSATSACVPPLNVNFTNKTTSSSTITYKWDFGNGNSSTKQNGDPQTYSKTGNYSVKLIVADTNGCKDSLTKQINIGKPVADFYESTKKDTACVKNSINTNNTFFTNTSTSGNYTWTFDAGTTPSTSNQFNPGPVYFSTPGLHKVTLSVNANNCSDVKTINIMVQDPKIQIGINHSYSCRDTLTSFYNIKSVLNSGPVATYNWTFPNFPITKKGKPFPSNTNTATPKCYYNTFDSTYSVRQINIDTVSCQYLTTAGCYSNIATTVDTISEMWARIIPNIHEGCKDLTVTFSDSSTSHMKSPIDVWQWDFGDGTKQTNNSKTSPSHTYKSPGTYYATLIIKDNDYNCSDTSWKTEINVGDSLLPIDFTLSKNSICRGDSVQFTNTTDPVTASKIDAWNYSSNKENLSACFQNKDGNFIFNDTVGIHTITLTAEYNGCLIKKNHTLTVNGPIAHFDYIQDCRTPKIIKLINQAEGTGTVSWNIGGHIIPANPDTTVVDLSSFVPPISYGDVVIKQLIKGGTCGDDSTSSTIHYGVVKSNFNITDTTGKILNPVNGNILLGDASTGQKYLYDAQNSVDIYSQDCYRSYTFLQEGFRPRVWTLSKDTVIVSKQTKTGADNQIVQIIARNQNNCVDTSTIKIRIFDLNPQYVATIKNKVTNKDSIVTTVCLPTTLTFNGATSTADTTIQKYDWKFSDGSSGSGKIITHTFDSNTQKSDTISVTLTLTDVNGFSKTSQTIIPIYKPTATITAIPSIHLNDSTVYICDKDKVIFNATSQQTLSYQWTYENGYQTFTNNSTSPIFTVPNGQSSNIQKVLVNFVETATGCTGQTYRKINTQIYPTPSIISNVVNGIGCGNPSFNGKFSDNPSLNPPCNYTWNLGVNNIISTNPTTSYTYSKGTYKVILSLTTQANGCKKSDSLTFEVVSPTANITINKNNICQGEELTLTMINPSPDVKTFKWDFGDGFTDTTQTNPVKHTYSYVPPSGKTIATLYVQNNSCSNPYYQNINMYYVHADFTITDLGSNTPNDTVTCLGQGFNFMNTSVNGDTYKWQYDNQTTVSKDVNSYVFPAVGTYNVHLFVSNNASGCKDDTIKKVVVVPNPTVKGHIDPVCFGKGSITLATADTLKKAVYTWSPQDLFPGKTTVYTVTVTDTNNCSAKDDVMAVVIQDIAPKNWDTTIVIGDKVNLPIDNQYGTVNFSWTPTDGLSCLQCINPTVQPLKDITYNVVMKDTKNCGFSNNGTFIIKVKPETHLKLPTTFTPNGDGINDVVYVKGWGIKTLETYEIYNRWGELIFKTSNIEEGWDGYYKGELQNNDVYAYKVIGTGWKIDPSTGQDIKLIKEGYIHLMR